MAAQTPGTRKKSIAEILFPDPPKSVTPYTPPRTLVTGAPLPQRSTADVLYGNTTPNSNKE
jgi:hypothetical protein